MNNFKKLIFLIIIIVIRQDLSSCQNVSDINSQVRMGVSQINITPELPVMMSGYDARKTPFTGVHDELYASALYFSKEKIKVMIITTDLIGFSFAFVDDIKTRISSRTGIPSENIMITAVHNHGGPAVSTYEDSLSEANEKYIAKLKEKLVILATKATENPFPFKMGICKGICKLNINRRAEFADGGIWLGRNQDGPCDHELDAIKFEDMNKKTIAVLINWPCHGTASGQDNYRITGDWPGATARYIKKMVGKDIIVAVTAGASADINPIYGPGSDFNEIEAVGYHAGKEACRILGETQTIPVKALETTGTSITFPGKKACKDQFPQKSYESGPDVTIRLSVFKIGELLLAGVSGELMTEIGMEVKSQSPYSGTVIITHCNGSSGYICTDKSFSEGGYEIKVTRLMPGAEKPLVGKMLDMIHSF